MKFVNPSYNRFGTIDCEYQHPELGWIPFTADPADVEPLGRALHAAIIESGQPIAPAPEPDSPEILLEREREVMVVSAFQARAALLHFEKLDETEAAVRSAPKAVQIAWEHARDFKRNSPTIKALAPALGLTDEQLDDLFRFAATIEA